MLVVMHPVRRVGQPLDTVQVRHIVVVGLGQFLAEVAIALPPDDQGGCSPCSAISLAPVWSSVVLIAASLGSCQG